MITTQMQYTHHSERHRRTQVLGFIVDRGTSPLNKQEGNAAMDLSTQRETNNVVLVFSCLCNRKHDSPLAFRIQRHTCLCQSHTPLCELSVFY